MENNFKGAFLVDFAMTVAMQKNKGEKRRMFAVFLGWWRRKKHGFHAIDEPECMETGPRDKRSVTAKMSDNADDLCLESHQLSKGQMETESCTSSANDGHNMQDDEFTSRPPAAIATSFETPPRRAYTLSRVRTSDDSFMGSLESIDSLAESYWDPDDDESQKTPIVANTESEFLLEHVDFLREKTQPRSVQAVWNEKERSPFAF